MRKAKALFKSWVTRGNSSPSSPSSMNSGEIEHLKSLNESNRQSSSFHVTNPFASEVEELSGLSARAEIAADDIIANMFLYDVMSDNMSNAEQNSQMAYFSQLNSSRTSSDSANFVNGTAMNCGSVWPPMNNSAIAWGDWPNSNGEQATSSNISKSVEDKNAGMALGEITPQVSLGVDPLGSGVPVFAASRNAVADTASTPSGNQLGKRETAKEVNQNYTFTTPPLLDLSTFRLECTATPQDSGSGSVASSSSTITRGIKETEAINEDLGRSMAQLKQVQTELSQENSDHAQRAEVLMKEVEELRRGVLEMKTEGRINQDKMETTMASVKGLTEQRISEMTAIMAQRDQQADERLTLMSETMHRREIDVDKRMVDLMTTVQDLTLGVKAVMATIPSRPSPVPVALNPANVPSTNESSIKQPTNREVVQCHSGTKCDQRNWNPETVEEAAKGNTPNTIHGQALAEAITSAMSKSLEPLLAAKEAKNIPTKYRGTRDGIIDGWLMLMKRYLEKAHAKDTPLDRAWTIVEFLENEAQDYIMNKSEAERDTDEKVFALLARRFGTGSSKFQIQQQFRTRNQSDNEDYMQYLDALEGLRSQGFPNEDVTVRRYEIMQRFIEGVRSFELKRNLALMYAQEQYVDTPPTVEALRFTAQQYLHMRGPIRSENYPAPQQHQEPLLASHQNPIPAAAPQAPNGQLPPQPVAVRQQPPKPSRACVNCGDPSHFVADCTLKDRAHKPVPQLVTSCRTNPAGEWSCPSNSQGMNNDVVPAALPAQAPPTLRVTFDCTGNTASECMVPGNAATEEQVKAAWYAPVANSADIIDTDDQIRVISTSEEGGPSRPVVVTCGEKQILTTLEAPAPDCTETLTSIHLLLSAEQKARPNLTLAQLKEELCRNTNLTIASRPLPHFTRSDETKLAPIQKVKTIAPVPIAITVDGVDMKFDAIVVLEGHFPQGLYLGTQELRCYNIGVQDAQGEAQIDERASLVVAFGTTLQKPIPLFGMIDTGSGVSILSLSAYKKIAPQHELNLSPYDLELFAANGKTITAVGIAEDVSFQLGGHTLKTNFVVIADHIGSEDFLLGRNFLRTYNVLVDLAAMKVTIRNPETPRIFKAIHEVSDQDPSFVVSAEEVTLGPFERKVVRAKIITQQPNEFRFRNVMVHPCSIRSNSLFDSEDTLTSVGEDGVVFLALRNQTAKEGVRIKEQTVVGKAVLTNFVFNSVPIQDSREASKLSAEFVNQVHRDLDLDTSSEFSSFAQNFLSSTEPSEMGLSENEKRKRTDPQLLKPIPGPDLSSVLSSWGEGARDKLASVLNEYDDLIMKNKSDIGRCKIAKHRIELEPEAIPHREGARRMSPDKAAKANQEVQNLLALGLIQPSYSPWASGIVMVKKKSGELRFCCDFRPLNDVTVKDAFPLPRIDESLSRIANAKIFTSIDLAWAFWQIPLKKRDRRKTAFACELGLFEWRRMPFGLCNASATFQRSITRALQKIQQRHGSVVMAYIDDIVIATETIEDHLERIREVFECLREAGFKMRAEKCDFMRTETKYLGRVVSAEGIKPDLAAVSKIQEWMPPRNKEELQSFLGFANYYRDFIPFHAAKVQPMQELLRKNQHFYWKEKHQEAFDSVKQALADATALAAPNEEGRFVLDTDASAVAIAGILHQEQEYNGKTILRPIVYGSKSLTRTQMNYGAPKLEMYAVFYFIKKFHSYLAGREFTLRVDNQALSWLKTYSMDQAMIGRWIARLDQYHFKTIHRPRTQHRNADGLSKRTNDYVHREKIVEALPEVSKGFSFMSQKDYEELPTVPYIDKHGKFIPNHPELPPEARAQLPVLYILKKPPKEDLTPDPSLSSIPWYPQVQWGTTPTSTENDRPNCILSVTTKVPAARLDTTKRDPALRRLPTQCQEQADALRLVGTELHEHQSTMRGLKDLHLAQNRDVHLLALKKLMKNEPLDDTLFPEDVQDFAKRYYHQKKDLLFLNQNDILCVNYIPQQRAMHVRPCMIVMPQLYQHEILYRAHDESGHQGVGKVLARIQERHTWPGIKRDVVNHIKHCLTCQQTKHPAGNPCYPLQSINSSNFNDLVQFDHLKLCKTTSGNNGLLVIIDHFTKFAEAIPCAHDEYDAQTTAKIILNKWFARHGTPARMQSDNATNFTAEIAQELMKASQVTKVTSTPAHPRGNGLVERQNRTLLTLLRVYTSRRMLDWDEHIDGVLGAYNSTRHATTGFSPYMLQHGAEKSIPLSFIYPEFAAREFESKEEFVEHLLARQQEIHELVRRNTHQAQVRQKQKFDRHLKAKAHAVGDAVWVFCHIIPKGGTRKLLRAWRGPHKVTNVLQDGRLYVLDTGQKVHFERLKKHVPAPWDWAAHQPFGLDQNVAIIADPYVEESNEEITSDISRDSFLPEQLPEASFEMEPTAPVPPRTIQTRTQSALEQGIPRRRFSHFGYPSESESDQEPVEQPIEETQQPMVCPEIDDLEPLYSDQEEVLPEPAPSLVPSPSGTSAPLLSNPALTDTLSNFPLFSSRAGSSVELELAEEAEPQEGTGGETQEPGQSMETLPSSGRTATKRGRPRGRPPGRRRGSTTSSSRALTRAHRPYTRSRGRVRTRAQSQTLERAMTLPNIAESISPEQREAEQPTPSQAPPYQLRRNRAPRYRCGTCGSRNCSCLNLIRGRPPDKRLARGVDAPATDSADTEAIEDHMQHTIRSIQAKDQDIPQVHHIVITTEKTYSSIGPGVVPPLETTLKAMQETSSSDCPTYRFKEWTWQEKSGLEFTLAAIIPPLPPSMVFGKLEPEDTKVAMVRCITAQKLWQQYGVTSPPGDVYHPTAGWWLLVTSLDETSPVNPGTLLICLENLRTLVEFEDTLCFHLADIYRGKFLSQHWLQLLAITFCRQTKIRLLDKYTYAFENPVTVLEALSVVHDWSCTNLGDRPLRRTVWQDHKAILDHLTPNQDNQSTVTGKLLTTHPKVKPNYLSWISYEETDILQARDTVAICCPADLLSYSAMARYVIREYGQEEIFKLRPAVGKAIHLAKSPDAPWNNDMFLLFTRASNKHPMLHDVLHLCLSDLVQKLAQAQITRVHLPIYDPERSINMLPAWYSMLRDHFIDSSVDIVLHDRVYVSIALVRKHLNQLKPKA